MGLSLTVGNTIAASDQDSRVPELAPSRGSDRPQQIGALRRMEFCGIII
jgi:hypothetical protein